ncbi:hypothetical protein [Pontibaca methylaminivorans]|uniref:hypothetical protein n=1 Tax=Pontibaca methylaminivorans TaxID=515897 RepID=UPI002FDB2316
MNGVVLWRDRERGKAVIWCSDHGDLAFCRDGDGGEQFRFGPGDLVEFDLAIEQSLRWARNPRLMVSGAFSDLAQQLLSLIGMGPQPGTAPRASAEILPFRSRVETCPTGM